MRFALTEDQRLLRDGAAEALSGTCTPERVRSADAGFDPELWRTAAEVGLLGVLLPESAGGLGLGVVEAALVAEQAGRVAFPGPLIDTAVVAPVVLRRVAADTDLFGAIATGEVRVAAATDPAALVSHPTAATHLLLAGPDRTLLLPAEEVACAPQPTVDPAVPAATVDWPADATPLATGEQAAAAHTAAVTAAATCAAAMLVGLATSAIELAVAHARTRVQFGQPIGAFQAVKHLLADAHLEVEFARPVTYRAAWCGDHDPADAPVAAALAKIAAGRAAERAARAALQVHGAIGYTWESDLHLWLKRIWVLDAWWGSRRDHLATLAAAHRLG